MGLINNMFDHQTIWLLIISEQVHNKFNHVQTCYNHDIFSMVEEKVQEKLTFYDS